MQRKRDIFNQMVKDTPLHTEQEAEGSVFQIVNFRNISKTMTDIEFAKWLTIDKRWPVCRFLPFITPDRIQTTSGSVLLKKMK